ncbi:LANO_0F01222g1_1 [Lachancea nothofagi CBS 11611]|uniref:LANO_0F01222g1_1 n=1 Tax=Lachancea nothofagi CBS 11611 TaxID=1266666 RepID=A0A1G4K650_9SACH|nr:LANO_0F01222g1_1 [Lachancea nothofagi CBS 11611]
MRAVKEEVRDGMEERRDEKAGKETLSRKESRHQEKDEDAGDITEQQSVKASEAVYDGTDTQQADEEEEEGDTRCICGETDPPDESGLYIQCEECSVWQHGFCVGITEGEGSAPDKYWCEQCRADLHSLYTTEAGQRRSVYKPAQHSKRQNRRSRKDDDLSPNEVESAPSGNGSGRAPSIPHVASIDPQDATVKLESQQKGDVHPEDPKPRKKQQRRKDADHEQMIHGRRDSEEERRSLDRRRATSSAREEKQYQLMLEKALKESRRTSQADDELEPHIFTEEKITEEAELETTVANKPELLEEPPKKRAKPNNNGNSPPGISMTSSEEESKRKSKRGGPRKLKSRTSSRASSSNGNSSNTSEIGISKPIKPRLPTQRTSVNEMRRRVGAILEFISRTQFELSEDQIEKQKLTEFVENQDFVKKVDLIYSNFDESLKMMDDLTRKLLVWEKKYAIDQ